jgi:hypothetical protein
VVSFHALWRSHTRREEWQTLLVYICSCIRGLRGAQDDFGRRLTAPANLYSDSSSMSRELIRHGTQISIVPELAGFRFNPPTSTILWLEDWHCIEFRMQALSESLSHLGVPIEGHIAFYVGPILIGETRIYAIVAEGLPDRAHAETIAGDHSWQGASTIPYRAIFVSYSHEDSYIVNHLERAYRALGDSYLRDISVLRSGEAWDSALLTKIDKADIFQLCWSEAAKRSPYVEREWRHALASRRKDFIRPMYWKIPMAAPPPELNEIHFAYIPLDSHGLSQGSTEPGAAADGGRDPGSS